MVLNLTRNLKSSDQHFGPSSEAGKERKVGSTQNRFNMERGTWIGDMWLPPEGWKLFTTQELQDIYKNVSILWIGDSTARRSAMTMYALLNETMNTPNIRVSQLDNDDVLSVNRDHQDEKCEADWFPELESQRLSICRRTPSGKSFDYISVNCNADLESFISSEISHPSVTKDADLIVISLGIWDLIREIECGIMSLNPTQRIGLLNRTIDAVSKLTSENTTVIWRTIGQMPKFHVGVARVNNMSMGKINEISKNNSNIMHVDWEKEVYSRSIGKDRISGDIDAHFGLQLRLVLLQMITNRFIELTNSR